MFQKQFTWLFVAAVVLVPLSIFTAIKWYENNYSKLPVLVGEEHRVSDFRMTNSKNETVTINNWNGKIVVADFFFTHCGTICPKMTASMKMVQDAFPENQKLLINTFSIDPERDSAARLASYAERFKINTETWNLLTGDKTEIYRLARKSFMVSATDGDGGPDDFIHSDRLVLVDTKQRIRGYYSGTDEKEVKQLIRDIKKLMNE